MCFFLLIAILLHTVSNLRRRYREASNRRVSREVPLDHAGRGSLPRDDLEAAGPSPARIAEDREQLQRLAAFLPTLTPRQRQVAALRAGEERAYADIGRRVACTAEAAWKTYERTLQLLARKLNPTERDGERTQPPREQHA